MDLSGSLLNQLRYHRWATEIVLAEVMELAPEQLMKDLKGSFASVYDTVVHLYQADCIWLDRLEGKQPGSRDDYAAPGCMYDLKDAWLGVLSRFITAAERLGPDASTRVLSYKTLAGQAFETPVWEVITHIVNHGTYHRGQITTMLRQLGAKPSNLDLIRFYRERAAASAT